MLTIHAGYLVMLNTSDPYIRSSINLSTLAFASMGSTHDMMKLRIFDASNQSYCWAMIKLIQPTELIRMGRWHAHIANRHKGDPLESRIKQ